MPNAPRALLLARRQRAVEPVVAAVDLARRAAPRPGRARCFDALPLCRSLARDDVVELLDGRRLGRRRRNFAVAPSPWVRGAAWVPRRATLCPAASPSGSRRRAPRSHLTDEIPRCPRGPPVKSAVPGPRRLAAAHRALRPGLAPPHLDAVASLKSQQRLRRRRPSAGPPAPRSRRPATPTAVASR